jgi:hypothetical protein
MSAPFPSTYSVQQHQGKPVFAADGRPVTLPSYCGCGPAWGEVWKAACRRFVRHGCRIFWLMPTGGYNGEWGTTPFWTGPGQIHSPPLPMPDTYIGLDQQARTFIDLTPEARFFVRMMDLPPASWGQAYPDHMLLNCDGHRYESASLASDRYLDELRRFLQALTRHCEAADWAERVIGYVIYPLGEGATQLACEGYLFDQSPVMQQAFRGFLRRKYGTDAALREAWSDPKVTLETAAVLGDADFRRRDPSVRFWPEARQVQPERDYFDCQRPLFRRYVRTMIEAFRAVAGPGKLCGFDGLKGNMLGWMTHPVFSGGKWKEHYGDQFLATGTTGMAEILDWPELDLIATPHDYRCRWVGFGYDPEGIGDSVYLHGKVMFTEEDQRSHANSERGLFGSLEPGEEEAVLYRNLVASLSKGHQTYPMDVCVGYFEDDGIQRLLARRRDIEADFLDRPRADVPSVVMLVDDQAAAYTDFSAEYNDLAVIRQRIHGMNHCGVPTRTFLWDDLLRDNFPACHRLFLLPNCYRSDDATLARLREKLFRSGNVVVFGPGSGITDGTTVSPDFAVRLLGLPFELYDYDYPRFVTLDNGSHPLTAGFGACEVYGDTLRYGPMLVPRETAAPECTGGVKPRRSAPGATPAGEPFIRLGTIALDNGKRRPGLVVKEFGRGAAGNGRPGPRGPGDYAVVFTAAVPLPSRFLRNLARFSGTHVYDDEDDVVYADTSMVAVHAVKPGPRAIHLPGRFRVRDVVSGKCRPRATEAIRFRVTGPVTRWFTLSTC